MERTSSRTEAAALCRARLHPGEDRASGVGCTAWLCGKPALVKGQGVDSGARMWHFPAMHEEPFNLLGIPPEDWAKTPETVRFALGSLLDIVQAQSQQIKELHIKVRDLEAKLGQSSRNSSKPPSSDPPSVPPIAKSGTTDPGQGGSENRNV
jgi:hypothetical protein